MLNLKTKSPAAFMVKIRTLAFPKEDRTGKIREDLSNRRGLPCSQIAKLSIVKMLIIPKLILIKIPAKILALTSSF